MVNGKNKVLTELLKINVSCLENAVVSIRGNRFEVQNYGKLNFSNKTVLVQYFMLSKQVVYLCLSICFQGSCLHTFDQDTHLIYLGFFCVWEFFSSN